MVRSLPVELIKRGHDVRVIVPKYGFVDYSQYKLNPVIDSLTVISQHEFRNVAVEQISLDGVPVYLVSSSIFNGSDSVYGGNEVEKFWVFSECVSEIVLRLGWCPDILHCHDWHTALVPMLARRNREKYRTLLTIHNIRYQGYFDENILYRSHLGLCWDAGILGIAHIPWNLMVQGILWADIINAVSETFAREIVTPEGGQGMQEFLKMRERSVSGIRNGLGYEEYDPSRDQLITARYSAADIDAKYLSRKGLISLAGWEEDIDIPIVGMVSRLDEQKGMDIILDALPAAIKAGAARFVFLGRGNDHYEDALLRLERRFPASIRAFITFDNEKAHLIYAGSDMFLMPSKWEPCGLGQLIAMRYGAVPIVRSTGGLADTVTNLGSDMKKGSGFVFQEYAGRALVEALERALTSYKNKPAWRKLVERIMKQDFSWSEPGEKYEQLYAKALGMSEDEPAE